MSYPERRKIILARILEDREYSVVELAGLLNASPATIRRDLLLMDQEGLLKRTHGGFIPLENKPFTGFKEKIKFGEKTKTAIAEKAASFIQDGDSLFMDCGSTVFFLCPFLKKFKGLKIITNSLPVMAELMDFNQIELNLVGGELDRERKSIHGRKAGEHIRSYNPDKAFLGIDGISKNFTLSSHSEKEAGITEAFMEGAKEIFLLADKTKVGKPTYLEWGSMQSVHYWITDFKADYQQKEMLEDMNTQLIEVYEKGVEVL